MNTAEQAREVAGALDFTLDLDELETLDEHARTLHSRRKDLNWLKGRSLVLGVLLCMYRRVC